MAIVSHPALSPEWSFPSPISPFDAATFSSHVEIKDHVPAVHHAPIANKRRAREIEWDEDEVSQRGEAKAKKVKTSPCHAVDTVQLHRDNNVPHAAQAASPSAASSPQIEQVISILVDALTASTSTAQMRAPSPPPEPSTTVLPSKDMTRYQLKPTSPLSNCPNRAPFIRKVIGGSCAGRTEPSLYRWVLCKNHFLRIRYLDPTTQTPEWVQNLHNMGWEDLHPFFQGGVPPPVVTAGQNEQAFGTLGAFSRWIEDEYEYDNTEDPDGEWSDEDEDGEPPDDAQDPNGTGVWDSGIVLQLPGKS